MNKKTLKEKLKKIEHQASKILSLIEVVSDSCGMKEYTTQESVLNCAKKEQKILIEEISDLDFEIEMGLLYS